MAEPWNVNIHYDGKLAEFVPPHAASVLEVGCGDGFLAARLSKRVPDGVAVDVDTPVLERAKQRFPDAPVRWLRGDILDIAGELGAFDAVMSALNFPVRGCRCLRSGACSSAGRRPRSRRAAVRS